jgi:hypothetical protein
MKLAILNTDLELKDQLWTLLLNGIRVILVEISNEENEP